MRRILQFVLLSLCVMCAAAQGAAAQVSAIGEIRAAKDAKIIRAGAEIVASVGSAVAEKDILMTGSSGTLGIVFNDNSVITLGPSSLFTMTEFVFKPQENKFGLLGAIYAGTMEYISGKISKLARDAAKFNTPYTTVAARGTRLLIRGDE